MEYKPNHTSEGYNKLPSYSKKTRRDSNSTIIKNDNETTKKIDRHLTEETKNSSITYESSQKKADDRKIDTALKNNSVTTMKTDRYLIKVTQSCSKSVYDSVNKEAKDRKMAQIKRDTKQDLMQYKTVDHRLRCPRSKENYYQDVFSHLIREYVTNILMIDTLPRFVVPQKEEEGWKHFFNNLNTSKKYGEPPRVWAMTVVTNSGEPIQLSDHFHVIHETCSISKTVATNLIIQGQKVPWHGATTCLELEEDIKSFYETAIQFSKLYPERQSHAIFMLEDYQYDPLKDYFANFIKIFINDLTANTQLPLSIMYVTSERIIEELIKRNKKLREDKRMSHALAREAAEFSKSSNEKLDLIPPVSYDNDVDLLPPVSIDNGDEILVLDAVTMIRYRRSDFVDLAHIFWRSSFDELYQSFVSCNKDKSDCRKEFWPKHFKKRVTGNSSDESISIHSMKGLVDCLLSYAHTFLFESGGEMMLRFYDKYCERWFYDHPDWKAKLLLGQLKNRYKDRVSSVNLLMREGWKIAGSDEERFYKLSWKIILTYLIKTQFEYELWIETSHIKMESKALSLQKLKEAVSESNYD
jgi:hypothetical protein